MRDAADSLKRAWSGYWTGGHKESCPGEAASLAPIVSLWREFFVGFSSGSRLLDLATGGGHTIRLALEVAEARGLSFEIDGVDIADLAQVRRDLKGARSTVRLSGDVAIEKLPFPDAAFDGISSQFGIEYANPDRACGEAVRVMRPAARGLFVVHSKHGAIVAAAEARLAAHRVTFPDGASFRLAKSVFERHASRAPRAEIARAETDFRTAVDRIAKRLPPHPAYGSAREIVSFLYDISRSPQTFDPADALRRVAFAEREIGDWKLRQQALVDSALDEHGVGRLRQYLIEAGADAEPPAEIGDGRNVLAWRCAFTKAG